MLQGEAGTGEAEVLKAKPEGRSAVLTS